MAHQHTMALMLSALAWAALARDCAAATADALAGLYDQRPAASVPTAARQPVADGRVDPGEWDDAAASVGFYSYTTGEVLAAGPVVFLKWEPTWLHVLTVVPQEPGRDLVARTRERDGKVYTDDSVEVYLHTPAGTLLQFIVNTAGTMADFRNSDAAWNGTWRAGAGTAEAAALPPTWDLDAGRYWLAEVSTPAGDAGVAEFAPAAGWSANVAVNRPGPWAAWAPTGGGSFAATERFCELTLAPAGTPFVQLTGLGNLRWGAVALRALLANPGPDPVAATLDMDLRQAGSHLTADAYGNVVGVIRPASRALILAPATRTPCELRLDVPETAANRLALRVTATGPGAAAPPLVLLQRHGPVTIEPPLGLTVGNLPSSHTLVLSIDTSAWTGKLPAGDLAAGIALADAAGTVVDRHTRRVPPGTAEVTLDYRDLPVGRYTCRVTAKAAGCELGSREAAWSHPGPAPWLDSPLYDECGKPGRVPLPWSPVEVTDRCISVWGRTYSWSPDSLLPACIRSQQTEWLVRPLRLELTIAGAPVDVPLDRFTVTVARPDRVELRAEGRAAGVGVTADLFVEYDGFLWATLRLTDPADGGRVERLHVVADLNPTATTLYQCFSRPLAGRLDPTPLRLPWRGDASGQIANFYHWFGHEDGGLGFTYDSLEHWLPESEDAFCTLDATPTAAVYRIHLLDRPAPLAGRVFRFGLQATPIKPLPPDYHAMLAGTLTTPPWKTLVSQAANADMALVWPQPNGTTMQGLQNPYHVDAEAMAACVKQAHDLGIAFVGVANCPQKISPLNDEFTDYRLEWETVPASVLNWEGTPHHQNCGRPLTLRKWLFYGWAVQNVQRFGLDGLYFDGWQAGTMGCANPHHGCGWTDAAGARHLTVPVLEGREFNQRLLLFLQDHVAAGRRPTAAPPRDGFPRGHLWIHSWEFVPPVMGFATEWLTGEFSGWPTQGPSLLTPEGTYGKCLGMGLFRARCLSTNWGVPNLFDALMWEHTENHPTDRQTRSAFAWFLPHGVPLGISDYVNQATAAGIVRATHGFGVRTATFTPAWRPNPYLAVVDAASPDLLLATWDHGPGRPVLAVVSNLHVTATREVTVAWLPATAPATVRDALADTPIACRDNRFTLTLGPEAFALLRLE